MDNEEFSTYFSENSNAVDMFCEKAVDFQEDKNKQRAPAKRLNNTMVANAAEKMVDQFIESVYEKIGLNIKEDQSSSRENWISFIEENEIFDSLEDSVGEMVFE